MTSIALALAVSIVDLGAADNPHLSQNRDSAVIVVPQFAQKLISVSF